VCTILWINNIPVTTTSSDLRSLCSIYGRVKSSRVVTNGMEQSLGFGYVEMMTETAAEQARLSLNGLRVLSQKIEVMFAVNLILPTGDC
jgi:RNA recognition motif-containing protein